MSALEGGGAGGPAGMNGMFTRGPAPGRMGDYAFTQQGMRVSNLSEIAFID